MAKVNVIYNSGEEGKFIMSKDQLADFLSWFKDEESDIEFPIEAENNICHIFKPAIKTVRS